MTKFKNKTALVTGGTSGMGLATAKELISEGATVIITGRDQTTVDETVNLLGPSARGLVSDTSKSGDLFSLQASIKKLADHIDILFVNAGYGKFAPIEQVDEAHFDELFNLLTKGTFFTAQQVLPLMKAGGSIIFNTSIVTGSGFRNFSVYSAAKAAVQSFIKTFAAECTDRNIRVNGISPGYISTKGFEKTGLSAEQIKGAIEGITPTLPFRRFGEAVEIAKAVSFLASDEASYIHGTELVVDGGLSVIK